MCVQKTSQEKTPHEQCDVSADCQMKEKKRFNAFPSPPSLPSLSSLSSLPFPPQVHVDAVRQIGHALHLCLLLWSERLLPQTEKEEKGARRGRGG